MNPRRPHYILFRSDGKHIFKRMQSPIGGLFLQNRGISPHIPNRALEKNYMFGRAESLSNPIDWRYVAT